MDVSPAHIQAALQKPALPPPPTRNVVLGQRVREGKVQRSREFRQNMTAGETALWGLLRANRFRGLRFRRQQIIDEFIVDFYCHAAGLVIEVDGAVHAELAGYDVERDRILSARGLRVLRFTNAEVIQRPDAVLTRLEAYLREIT
jgi:very-short-patch-repair endonuclease